MLIVFAPLPVIRLPAVWEMSILPVGTATAASKAEVERGPATSVPVSVVMFAPDVRKMSLPILAATSTPCDAWPLVVMLEPLARVIRIGSVPVLLTTRPLPPLRTMATEDATSSFNPVAATS